MRYGFGNDAKKQKNPARKVLPCCLQWPFPPFGLRRWLGPWCCSPCWCRWAWGRQGDMAPHNQEGSEEHGVMLLMDMIGNVGIVRTPWCTGLFGYMAFFLHKTFIYFTSANGVFKGFLEYSPRNLGKMHPFSPANWSPAFKTSPGWMFSQCQLRHMCPKYSTEWNCHPSQKWPKKMGWVWRSLLKYDEMQAVHTKLKPTCLWINTQIFYESVI